MFSSKALIASRARTILFRTPVTAIQRVQFSNPTDKLKQKEVGEEKAYFSKQDAEVLKNLVKKLEDRDKLKTPKAKEHHSICEDLDAIFKSHGLDKAKDHQLLYTELMEWKRHQHWNSNSDLMWGKVLRVITKSS